jgi:hypothetical protein
MEKTRFLASVFDNAREIVEAAETPFAKLCIFVLPILAPIVPASFTAIHIYKLLEDQFSFGQGVNTTLAVIVGVVLELLGYVGAVEFIHAMWEMVRHKAKIEFWVPVLFTGAAYGFYLWLMYQINVQLGLYFNTPPIINKIIGFLAFITVPTGLLAGNYLAKKANREVDKETKIEDRDFKLKSKMIDKGLNPFGFTNYATPQDQPVAQKRVDWRTLAPEEKSAIASMRAEDIQAKYGVSRATAFNWKKGQG